MKLTEVGIKLVDIEQDRLKAFAFVVFDNAFIVRDIKIVQGTNGYFVAMPNRKKTFHCPYCHYKNSVNSRYCNDCGRYIYESNQGDSDIYQDKIFTDIAHPINARCREMIQRHVIAAFKEEMRKASMPGYAPRYDDDYMF